jgi:hypothetical protein
MRTIDLRRRLETLEKDLSPGEAILLLMPGGRVETLQGEALELFSSAVRGDRTPEMELIAQSVSSIEPHGAHMIDLVRALLNGPRQDP